MSIEKLKRAKMLIQECIDEYQGEESTEEEDSGEDSFESEDFGSMGEGTNDKIKMAAALMKRNR